MKTKFLNLLLSLTSISTISTVAVTNTQSKNKTVDNSSNYLNNGCINFDAKLFGAKRGIITIDISDNSNCIIVGCDKNFYATGEFNFNNGHFEYNGELYRITKIADGAFTILFNQENYYFEDCNLTIPKSIEYIGANAFANKSRLLNGFNSVKLEGGIRHIGDHAFYNAYGPNKDYYHARKIELPWSVEYIGNNAFAKNEIREIFIHETESIIETDLEILRDNGCFCDNPIIKICFSNEKTKKQYENRLDWGIYSELFSTYEIQSNFLNIPAKAIGADKGSVKIKYTNPNDCSIVKFSDDFKFVGYWNPNFEKGIIQHDGQTFKITSIDDCVLERGNGQGNIIHASLYIPSTVTKIGDYAFCYYGKYDKDHNSGIYQIKFSENCDLKTIGDYAFYGCVDFYSQERIKFTNKLESIGKKAFAKSTICIIDLNNANMNYAINIVDTTLWSYSGFMAIYLADEDMFTYYIAHPLWSQAKDYFIFW